MRTRFPFPIIAWMALAVPLLAQEGQQPPTLPEERVQPRLPTETVTPTPFDGALAAPSLSDLEFGDATGFGENTGVLRGRTSLFDTNVAGDVVTRQEIIEKLSPDVFSALQNEVGVQMQRTAAGQASPYLRGVTGQQVLMLIDGIRLNNSIYRFGPNQYFNTIDPGMIDHFEIIRGQGSVLWGSDAIGGVINVVTRSADFQRRWHGYGGTEFHEFFNTADTSSYSRMNVEGWVNDAGIFSGASYLNVNDLDTGWDQYGRQPGTHWQQYAGDIKFNYLLDRFSMLTVALQHFEQQNLPRSDRFPGFPFDFNNSNDFENIRVFDPQQRDLGYIRYQTLYPSPLIDALTFTASYQRQKDDQTRPFRNPPRVQDTDVETTGLNLVGSKDTPVGRFITGTDWYYDDVDSFAVGGDVIIPDDATYQRIGWFFNWDLPVTDRLTTVLGVRYENIDAHATPEVGGQLVTVDPNYNDWIGSVGFIYEVDCGLHLVGSIAEGWRAPNLDELAANNPNVLQMGMDLPSLGLAPENSVTYEVGVKTNYRNFRSNTFVFWTDLGDNIVPVVAGANQFTRANQDSYIQGVEFDAEYYLWNDWWAYGNFFYTYGRNEITGGPLSRIPPTQGIAGLRWRARDLSSWLLVYTWLVREQDRIDPVRDVGDERIPFGYTPGFGTLNMRAGTSFGPCNMHRVSLSLENLTDQPYHVHGSGVLGSGITARFGYSLDY